jgi:drug/metabolite transporter (DMT)-like permease
MAGLTPSGPPGGSPGNLRIALAFAAIYVIWGSTYLAIAVAIEGLPPFLMAGGRHLVAGTALLAWLRWRGAPKASPREWAAATLVGGLLLLGGNGGVTWAEQSVPSGLAALMIATVPLWIALLAWLATGARPGRWGLVGLALGFAGVLLLVGPGPLAGARSVDPLGGAVLVGAALAWSTGSLYARRAPLPTWPMLATALEMVAGGLLCLGAGVGQGEVARLDLAAVSLASWGAFAYLVVFGSLIGFTAYIWLLGHVPAPRVATYAFVNPVVAVALGAALLAEPVTPAALLAATVIVAGVAVLTLAPRPRLAAKAGSGPALRAARRLQRRLPKRLAWLGVLAHAALRRP